MAQPNQKPVQPVQQANPAVETFSVHTAKREGQKAVETRLTFDWTGVSEDELRKLARRALVINWQRMVRTGDEPIPPEDNVMVSDLIAGTGRKARTISPARVLEMVKDDPAKAEALAKQLLDQAKAARK